MRREEIRDRIPRIGVIAAFLIVLLFIGTLAFMLGRWPGFMNPGVAECQASYHKARSASDTSIIDEQRPSTLSAKRPNYETCGYWRKVGLTR